MSLGYHITMRLEDSRNLVPGVQERRVLARTVLEIGKDRGLFLFSSPDTHLHIATTAGWLEAGLLAQAVGCALRARLRLPGPFEPARRRPIVDLRHLQNLLDYTLGNPRRHGNVRDPRGEASNLPDLLGLRLLGRYTIARLTRLLPRLTKDAMLRQFPVQELAPGRDPTFLAEAAAAALALPDLRGRGSAVLEARAAAVSVARTLGLGATATARHLGLTRRTVMRYRGVPPDRELCAAIQLQMGLLEAMLPATLDVWP